MYHEFGRTRSFGRAGHSCVQLQCVGQQSCRRFPCPDLGLLPHCASPAACLRARVQGTPMTVPRLVHPGSVWIVTRLGTLSVSARLDPGPCVVRLGRVSLLYSLPIPVDLDAREEICPSGGVQLPTGARSARSLAPTHIREGQPSPFRPPQLIFVPHNHPNPSHASPRPRHRTQGMASLVAILDLKGKVSRGDGPAESVD